MYILVVEDEQEIRFLLKYNLELDGHEVDTAGNGKNAMEKIEDRKPDLILMDIMMPEVDGIEATLKIKSVPENSTIPIFMLTAKSQLSDIETAFKAGADDYLTKPFDPESLNERIMVKYEKFKKNIQ